MLLKVDSYYSRFTDGFTEFDLPGDTAGQCMSSLLNRYPQLMVHMLDNDLEVLHKSALRFNGEFTSDDQLGALQVTCSDTLEITIEIPSGSGEVGRWIGAIVSFVVGVVLMIIPGTQILGMSSFYMGLSLVVGSVISAIATYIMTPDVPDSAAISLLNNSATYTFDGIKNTTPSGQPIQVVYGKHRVGGHVLSMYTVNESTTRVTIDGSSILSYDYLMAQIGLCEGEIEGVSDLFVNNYPVHYYDEVTSFEGSPDLVRLGTETQTPMKDFNAIRNTTSINLKVQSTASPITAAVDPSATTYSPMYGYVEVGKSDPITGDYKLTYVR